MNDETQDTQQLPPPPPAPRRLLRSRSDRMVWGVASGLGRYFGVDPVIFRIAFGVSIFFGGLGLLAYGALALFVPAGDGDDVEPAPFERSRWLGMAAGIGLALLLIPAIGAGFLWDGGWDSGWHWFWDLIWLGVVVAFAIGIFTLWRGRGGRGETATSSSRTVATIFLVALSVIVFPILALAAAFVTAIGHGVIAAIAVAVLGGVLVAMAFAGGARWLIVPAAALATGVGVAAAADLDFPASIGERQYRPVIVESIPEDGYEIGLGRLEVDLRGLDWSAAEVVNLDVDAGMGQVDVVVPEDVCVAAETHTSAGDLQITGEHNSGVDVDGDRYVGTNAIPRLELSGEVDVGQLRVINDDAIDLSDHHFDRFDDDDEGLARQRDAAALACAPEPASDAEVDSDTGSSQTGEGRGRRE